MFYAKQIKVLQDFFLLFMILVDNFIRMFSSFLTNSIYICLFEIVPSFRENSLLKAISPQSAHAKYKG